MSEALPAEIVRQLEEQLREIARLARRCNPEDLAQIEELARDGIRSLERLTP